MPADRSSRGRTRGRTRGMTQSAGWLRPDQHAAAETVIARFRRTDLPAGLAALHGRGLGHTARVLDPARGAIDEQFRRTGIGVDLGFALSVPDDVFLLVGATGRAAVVGDLLLQSGAAEVRVYRPADYDAPADAATAAVPDLSASDGSIVSDFDHAT